MKLVTKAQGLWLLLPNPDRGVRASGQAALLTLSREVRTCLRPSLSRAVLGTVLKPERAPALSKTGALVFLNRGPGSSKQEFLLVLLVLLIPPSPPEASTSPPFYPTQDFP